MGPNETRQSTRDTTHSSFHTTFNILEGLREAAARDIVERARFEAAEGRALEFIQLHRLYKLARTGAIIHLHDPADLSPYWHHNGLRGLDYMRATRYIADPRLLEALDLIASRRRRHGRWPVEKRLPGVTFFD